MNDAAGSPEAQVGSLDAGVETWRLRGDLTVFNVEAIYRASRAAPLPQTGAVDCFEVNHADSAALALLLEIKRRATSEGRPLAFRGLSPAVLNLAGVYGIAALLGEPAS